LNRKPIVHHIPVCPFSQRLEILLAIKGRSDSVEFSVVDITKSRDPALLRKAGGGTALPILELPDGRILKESLVILRYLDEVTGPALLRRTDPFDHAVENMLIAKEATFGAVGYRLVLNKSRDRRTELTEKLLACYRDFNDLLLQANRDGDFLFEKFGFAETVFTPLFMRFWFLDYYESFELPEGMVYDRVRRWRAACLEFDKAQQVSREQIVKVYYDYAAGAGNGALPEGRKVSSFTFDPDWRSRPWPPRDKYDRIASDSELGLA
jgi:glutathione S-transferase